MFTHLKSRKLAAAFAGVALLYFIPGTAAAQNQDQANSYAAFVIALSSITSAAGDVLEHEREQARMTLIRQAFTARVIHAFPDALRQRLLGDARPTTLTLTLDEKELLCGVRYKPLKIVDKFSDRDDQESISVDHILSLAQKSYLEAVISELEKKAIKSDIKDLGTAIWTAISSTSVAPPDKYLDNNEQEKNRDLFKKRCEKDLIEYEIAYYGMQIKIETHNFAAHYSNPSIASESDNIISQLPLFGPIGTLVTTVFNIIKPVALQASNMTIDYKNNQAIAEFLGNKKNQENLTTAGKALARKESDYLFAKRLALAGQFAENIAVINKTPIDLQAKPIQEACGQINQLYLNEKGQPPTEAFRKCYYILWKQYEPAIVAAVSAASAYDRIADTGNTATQLILYTALTKDFGNIVKDAAPESTWGDVTKMLTFGNAIKSLFSKETAAQVQTAIDAVRKN